MLKKIQKADWMLAGAFLAILVAWWVSNLYGLGNLAFGDRLPVPGGIGASWHAFTSAWQNQNPGVFLPAFNVVLFFEFLMNVVSFGHPAVAQRLILTFPIALSFATIWWFLLKIGVKNRLAIFCAGLIFGANLTVLGDIRGGAAGSLIATGLMPPILYFLYQIFVKADHSWRSVILTAIFLSLAFGFSDHVLIIAGFFVLGVFISQIFRRQLNFKLFVFDGLKLLGVFCLLSFSQLYIYFQITRGLASIKTASEAVLFADVRSAYAGFSFPSYLSLGGGNFYQLLFGGRVWGYLGYSLPILAAIGFYFGRKSPWAKPLLWIFAIVTLFVISTFLGLTDWLFRAFPLFFRFRNTARFGLLNGLILAVGVAFLIDYLWPKLKSARAFLWLLPILLVGASWPLVSGGVIKPDFEVPKYFETILAKTSQKPGPTLYFPWNYDTAKPVFWTDPNTIGLWLGYGQYRDNPISASLFDTYQGLAKNREKTVALALNYLSPEWIVVDKHYSTKIDKISAGAAFNTPQISGGWQEFASAIDKTGNFEDAVDTPEFRLYQAKTATGFFQAFDNAVPVSAKSNKFLEPLSTKSAVPGLVRLQPDTRGETISTESTAYHSDGVTPDDWSGETFKNPIEPGSKITIRATVPLMENGTIGMRDTAENGFSFDLTRQTGSGLPITITRYRNGSKSENVDLGARTTESHEFGFLWETEQVELSVDGKTVAKIADKSTGALPLVISSTVKLEELTIERLEPVTITLGQGTSQLVEIDIKQTPAGLNRYKLALQSQTPDFELVYRTPFAPGWQMKTPDGTVNSYAANGFYNGFSLKNCTQCEVELIYKPQTTRNWLLIINALIWVGAIGFLFFRPKNAK